MRARHGFESIRIGIVENDHITAGAQLLYRSFPAAGRLAIIPQGPLATAERADAARTLIDSLETLARQYRLSLVKVIKYTDNEFWSPLLVQAGFRDTGDPWSATDQTLLVRCDQDDDAILARMKSKCRYNLRLAQRKGVTVRVGGEDDIDTFYELLQHTARRQNFPIFPVEYLRYVWLLFAPRDKLRLFIADADGEPLAGVIATVAGDRVYYGWGGLSPERRNLMPNYVAHWAAIRWARSIGGKYYDLAGGGSGRGVDQFKSHWGGEPSSCPAPTEKFYGQLAPARRLAALQIRRKEKLRKLADRAVYHYYGRMPF